MASTTTPRDEQLKIVRDRLAAVAEVLQKSQIRLGLEFLSIPPNYYGDLGARYGLDDTALQRMAEFNILYDEDDHGRYFQVYTRVFAERFFFEIVERQDYDGFGAPNAPIRLAAQTRLSRGAGIPRV